MLLSRVSSVNVENVVAGGQVTRYRMCGVAGIRVGRLVRLGCAGRMDV